MPKFLEDKLKKQYGEDSDVPYKVMNKMGAMHGSKVTEKGKEMERKHEAGKKKGKGRKGKKKPGAQAQGLALAKGY